MNTDSEPEEVTEVSDVLSAAEHGEVDTVRLMLAEDARLVSTKDADGYTPLHRASYNGHIDVVKVLLECGADIEVQTDNGWRPLHSSCHWGHAEVAAVLLSAGADPNAVTAGGQTPLHLAATHGTSRELLALLLTQREIRPAVQNAAGETAAEVTFRRSRHHWLFELTDDAINSLDAPVAGV